MRTTLTLDDDVAGLLQERAKRRGVPFKVVVNETLRSGLGVEELSSEEPPEVIPHAFGFRDDIDLDRLNQLADELEAGAYAKGLQQQIPTEEDGR